MLANAALFAFGAMEHAGVQVGPFSEPRIMPAVIVETICALALVWGATGSWRAAMTGNLVAAAGVTLGMAALAAGGGPRTASNDLSHAIMLALVALSLILLFTRPVRVALHRT